MNREINDLKCENVMFSLMAEADGEEAPVSIDSVRDHLSICEPCRVQAQHFRSIDSIFRCQVREPHRVSLWPLIHERIHSSSRDSWLLAAFGLVILKFLDLIQPGGPSLMYMVLPLLLSATLFLLIRENPFRISTTLRVEEQTQ